MKQLLILFIFSFSLIIRAQNSPQPAGGGVKFPAGKSVKNGAFSYAIIEAPHATWGYDIYMEKKLFIHQPCIPGMPGNSGFKSKSCAETVAKAVIDKIKKGEMPPSLTPDDMKKMKVL